MLDAGVNQRRYQHLNVGLCLYLCTSENKPVIFKFNLLSLLAEGLRQLNKHPRTRKMDQNSFQHQEVIVFHGLWDIWW